MVTTVYLEHDALSRPTTGGQLALPETTDDTAPDDFAALWLDLGGGD